VTGDAVRIERVTEADVPRLLILIRALAEYEKLAAEVVASEAGVRDSLFGARPAAEAAIAYSGSEAVGFAVWFQNYSTFLGRAGLYLEDLFVTPGWRGRGIGRQLLTYVARIAVERHAGRMEWAVLDWNTPAIGFYERLGARPMSEWTVFRLTGDALRRLANSNP
jgi:GNAT superfamily N-acetyltransferase